MEGLRSLWRKHSQSKEVKSSGKYEKAFFDTIYRICYVTGLAGFSEGPGYKIYSSVIMFGLFTIFFLENLYYMLENLTMVELISSFDMLILQTMAAWKLISMAHHKNEYKKIAKSMDCPYFDVSTESRKKILDDWVTKHDEYITMLLKLRTYNLTVWNMMPFFDDIEYNLPLDLYIPFEYTSEALYYFTYSVVVIIFTFASYWVIISEAIIQVHLYLLICRYAVLADCFENIEEHVKLPEHKGLSHEQLITDSVFADRYVKRLGNLVDQHKVLLTDSMAMKKALRLPMLGQLSATCMLLCMTAYQAIATIEDNKGKFIVSLLYLGYNMFTFYHVCRSCEELTMQSYNIGHAVYFSGWEKGACNLPGVKCAIMMIIARANKPLIFLAGGMYPLSLRSYANLVKTSYSFLTMLLNTSNKTKE